jgi:SulP family sulfate permease
VPRADAVVLVIVLLITTFGSLIQAVGLGVAMACILFMKKASDLGEEGLTMEMVEDIIDEKPWQDELEFYDEVKDKVLIKHLKGPLFFGYTSYLKNQVATIDSSIRAVIIRMDLVPIIDQSGLYALEDVIFELQGRGVEVLLVNIQEQPLDMLTSIDIIPDLVNEECVFETVQGAYLHIKKNLKV